MILLEIITDGDLVDKQSICSSSLGYSSLSGLLMLSRTDILEESSFLVSLYQVCLRGLVHLLKGSET